MCLVMHGCGYKKYDYNDFNDLFYTQVLGNWIREEYKIQFCLLLICIFPA